MVVLINANRPPVPTVAPGPQTATPGATQTQVKETKLSDQLTANAPVDNLADDPPDTPSEDSPLEGEDVASVRSNEP
jgi:hypothetical protein